MDGDYDGDPDLFIRPDGLPMVFRMATTGSERAYIELLVEAGGGLLTSGLRNLEDKSLEENAIWLISPKEIVIKRDVDRFSTKYILDCVTENAILANLSDYRHGFHLPSIFIDYDPLDIMLGKKMWKDMKRRSEDEGDKVSDIEEDDHVSFVPSPRKKTLRNFRSSYSKKEQQAIVEWVIRNKAYNDLKGNVIWQKMENEKIGHGRTWQSLKEHFRKQILPKIHQFTQDWKIINKIRLRFGMAEPREGISSSDDDSNSPKNENKEPTVNDTEARSNSREPPAKPEEVNSTVTKDVGTNTPERGKRKLFNLDTQKPGVWTPDTGMKAANKPANNDGTSTEHVTNCEEDNDLDNAGVVTEDAMLKGISKSALSENENDPLEAGIVKNNQDCNVAEVEGILALTRQKPELPSSKGENDIIESGESRSLNNLRTESVTIVADSSLSNDPILNEGNSNIPFPAVPGEIPELPSCSQEFEEGLVKPAASSQEDPGILTSTQDLSLGIYCPPTYDDVHFPSQSPEKHSEKSPKKAKSNIGSLSPILEETFNSIPETLSSANDKTLDKIFGIDSSYERRRFDRDESKETVAYAGQPLLEESMDMNNSIETEIYVGANNHSMDDVNEISSYDMTINDLNCSLKPIGVKLKRIKFSSPSKSLKSPTLLNEPTTKARSVLSINISEPLESVSSQPSPSRSPPRSPRSLLTPVDVMSARSPTTLCCKNISTFSGSPVKRTRSSSRDLLLRSLTSSERSFDVLSRRSEKMSLRRPSQRSDFSEGSGSSSPSPKNVTVETASPEFLEPVKSTNDGAHSEDNNDTTYIAEYSEPSAGSNEVPTESSNPFMSTEETNSRDTRDSSSGNSLRSKPVENTDVPRVSEEMPTVFSSPSTSSTPNNDRGPTLFNPPSEPPIVQSVERPPHAESPSNQPSTSKAKTLNRINRNIDQASPDDDSSIPEDASDCARAEWYRMKHRCSYTSTEEAAVVRYLLERGGFSQKGGRDLWKKMEEAWVVPGRTWQSLKERFLKHIIKKLPIYNASVNMLVEADRIASRRKVTSPPVVTGIKRARTMSVKPLSVPEPGHHPSDDMIDDNMSIVSRSSTLSIAPSSVSTVAAARSEFNSPYNEHEDLLIINHILDNRRQNDVGGNVLWKAMERRKVLKGRSWQSMKERYRKVILKKISQGRGYEVLEPEKKRRCLEALKK